MDLLDDSIENANSVPPENRMSSMDWMELYPIEQESIEQSDPDELDDEAALNSSIL